MPARDDRSRSPLRSIRTGGRSCRVVALGAVVLGCVEDEPAVGPHVQACLDAISSFQGPNRYVYAAKWSPRSDDVLSGTRNEIRLLHVDTDAGTLAESFAFVDQPGNLVVEWSPDGRFALSGGADVRLLAVDVVSPSVRELARYSGHASAVYAVAWSPDAGHALSAGEDASVRLLRVRSEPPALEESVVFTGHAGKVFDVVWAPDGRHALSVGADGTTRVLKVEIDPPALREIDRFQDGEEATVAAWAPFPAPILTGSWGRRNAVRLWSFDTSAEKLIAEAMVLGHGVGLQVLEWSPDQAHLVTGGHGDTLQIFAAEDGHLRVLGMLGEHRTGVHSVGWSPDGDHVVLASSSGDVVTLVDTQGCD